MLDSIIASSFFQESLEIFHRSSFVCGVWVFSEVFQLALVSSDCLGSKEVPGVRYQVFDRTQAAQERISFWLTVKFYPKSKVC
jgi:hypothetical protein